MPMKPGDSIEFIDGPYDGHVEPLAMPAAELPFQISCCGSEDTFRLLHGQSRIHEREITSFAIYVRNRRGDRWVF